MKRGTAWIILLALVMGMVPAAAWGEEAAGEVELVVPKGKEARAAYLVDGDPFTRLSVGKNEWVEAHFAAGSTLYLEIFEAPERLEVALLDGAGEAYDSVVLDAPGHMATVDVGGAGGVRLHGSENWSLSALEVHGSEFEAPFALEEAGEMLVLLARTGDEWRLGGLLPRYAGENNVSVAVVYGAEEEGFGAFCALRTLEEMGIKRYPEFLGLRDRSVSNYNQAMVAMGSESLVLKKLVLLLRQVRPQVVVVPDMAGEAYGAALAKAMVKAVELAADPGKYPGTEAHRVERVYSLSAEGETVVSWETPLVMFGGRSAREVAAAAYENYTENRVYGYEIAPETGFALVYGEGAEGDSLLAGLDLSGFAHYAQPTFTPEPTFTPAPTDAPAPTFMPTPAATVEPAPVEEEGKPVGAYMRVGAVLTLGIIVTVILAAKKKKFAWVPVAAGAVCALGLMGMEMKKPVEAVATAEPTAAVTAVATHTPVPETPSPAPTDTPAPTSTPDPWAELFIEEGEEYFSDFETGHWQYRSENLYIDIVRVRKELEGRGPLVYYAADIYMRNFSSYRSGVRSYTAPWKFARLEKAVLALTGDNLVGEEKELKGCLIRKGKLYADYGKADTMVIGRDMDLQVYYPSEVNSGALLDSGVRDTYSFGPILVRDGVVNEDAGKHRVAGYNPRCGIGMVEPGHWVAITTDGRQIGYSLSIDLYTFARLFVDRGCGVAYNLDGGSSTAMVFMGDILNIHEGNGTTDTMRNWTDALMWGYSEAVPGAELGTEHNGYRKR